jgi:hypothetical protein
MQRFFRHSIVGDILWPRSGFFELEFKIGIFFGQQRIGNIVLKDNVAPLPSFFSPTNGNYRLDLGEGNYNASASV